MKKVLFVLLHGEKLEHVADPTLSEKGHSQIQAASASGLIPRDATTIICGTGFRHITTAAVAGLKPEAYSPLCGCPDSSDIGGNGEKLAVLACNTAFAIEKWLIPDTFYFARSCPDRALLVAGRPFMLGLGIKDAKEGMLYKLITDEDTVSAEILFSSNGKKDIH